MKPKKSIKEVLNKPIRDKEGFTSPDADFPWPGCLYAVLFLAVIAGLLYLFTRVLFPEVGTAMDGIEENPFMR